VSAGRTAFAAVLVAVGGLVASGKSTLARALAARIGAEWIDADRVRESLLGGRWARSFDPGFEDEVYVELLRRAESSIDSGHLVVLDACFPLTRYRVAARALAQRHAQAFLFVECRVSFETARERLAARDALAHHPGWEQIYRDLAAHWQPICELAPDEHLVLHDGLCAPPIIQTNQVETAIAANGIRYLVHLHARNHLGKHGG